MNDPMAAPDRQRSLAQYRRRAKIYDLELVAFEPIRRAAIARLQLGAGAIVLDVGCGTGLSFASLRAAVGSRGRVIGIEQSPDMLAQARLRVQQQGWRNVTLINAPAETFKIKTRADAAMFHFTHDILRNPKAICHVVQGLKPGARVVASGLQWSQNWAWTTNWCVMMAAVYSVTSLEGLAQPWSHLAQHLEQFEISSTWLDSVFIASGVVAKPTLVG